MNLSATALPVVVGRLTDALLAADIGDFPPATASLRIAMQFVCPYDMSHRATSRPSRKLHADLRAGEVAQVCNLRTGCDASTCGIQVIPPSGTEPKKARYITHIVLSVSRQWMSTDGKLVEGKLIAFEDLVVEAEAGNSVNPLLACDWNTQVATKWSI